MSDAISRGDTTPRSKGARDGSISVEQTALTPGAPPADSGDEDEYFGPAVCDCDGGEHGDTGDTGDGDGGDDDDDTACA